MANRKSRRMQTNSAYIGFGNRALDFNRRSIIPFEKIEKVYETELLNAHSESSQHKFQKKLTQKERAEIKSKVKKQLQIQRRTEIVRFVILVIVFIGILFLINYFIPF
jgi:hypothetical protein